MKKYNLSDEGRKKLAYSARKTLHNHPEISIKGGKTASKKSRYFGKGHLSTSKNKGVKFNKEWVKHLSESHKGIPSPKKNIPLSAEIKKKVSIGVLKNYADHPELKEVLRRKRLQQKPFMRDTLIELSLQEELKKRNIKFVTQKPFKICQADIFIPSLNTIIFADGCYWHGCKVCFPKLQCIVRCILTKHIRQRDLRITKYLKSMGYTVARFWEHDIKKSSSNCIDGII